MPEPVASSVAAAEIPADIADRLRGPDASQRAAALVDLAATGSEGSFTLITRAFDDPSIEVRNAAARALYSLEPDHAGSFTHALREAPSERRRKIGSAIAASGLAADAINSLTGETRDKTYSAFSILFLMAKAGEVQPLMLAIAKHPNVEVRLTTVKILALSNQQQVLPGLRNLAAREALPSEVHTAVMEAIYLLSNKSRDGA
jgi:HEAT repeat protein